MNEKEKFILQLIENNPFISQAELSEKTQLSRSAVAGYISALVKSGKLLGRAYILPKNNGVVCIGGSNIDRKLKVQKELVYGTSNPSETSISCGGVARNISENLGRMGIPSSLMTIVADDYEGAFLLEETKPYVDVAGTMMVLHQTTGTYTAVLNEEGDMAIALADMNIYEMIDTGFIEKRWSQISSAEMVLLDTNFPEEVLAYIIRRCKQEGVPLVISPVSSPKVKKLPRNLEGTTWYISNKDEAEELTGMKIEKDGDFFMAAEAIIEKGAENVVITRGKEGLVYYSQSGGAGVILAPHIQVDEVTGAGDALVAGVIYGCMNGFNIEDACKVGMTASIIALQSGQTVSPALNKHKLQETYKSYF
ncbi:carbohydrate kinase [Falsibacillus albus]|uniref:Winged helix-turn-helix transcriptional regulator n=1 Tax=Falsibacillus albus TaxID=2478915 RepID=A0A3L7JW01_9BACI|nr:carbohydrate kinase [Falsibacillus albus]RLQ94485.1 winged helix-turn-helix transcriptional regulator [Falsibacillus albus]